MSFENLKRKAEHCTTHHYGCYCREYKQQKKIELMQKIIDKLKNELDLTLNWMSLNLQEDMVECRSDEDCDHCHGLSIVHYSRETQKEVAELKRQLGEM